MAFKIYLDQTVIRIIDTTGRNNPIQYNVGQVKYYIKDGAFVFTDGLQKQTFGNRGYTDFIDKYNEPFNSEDDFISYLNSFINANIVNTETIHMPTVNIDSITIDDVDWINSDFTGWTGDPKSLFENVHETQGIYNDSTDNPKYFTLRLKRTRKIRNIGMGSRLGTFSNAKLSVLGSGDVVRRTIDGSYSDVKINSLDYNRHVFVVNTMLFEFYTADPCYLSNLFLYYTDSERKNDYYHIMGLNPDVDSGNKETIWYGGDEYIFTTTAQAYYISSSSANDTQTVKGEIIVIDDDGFYRQDFFSVALQGQTKVQIPTTNDWLCFAVNIFEVDDNTFVEGTVYMYEDTTITAGVPDDLSYVRSVIEAGYAAAKSAVFTVPELSENGQRVALAEIYQYSAAAINRVAAIGRVEFMTAEKGKVARVRSEKSLTNAYDSNKVFGRDTPLLVDPAADVYMNAVLEDSSANNVMVEAEFLIKLIIL